MAVASWRDIGYALVTGDGRGTNVALIGRRSFGGSAEGLLIRDVTDRVSTGFLALGLGVLRFEVSGSWDFRLAKLELNHLTLGFTDWPGSGFL